MTVQESLNLTSMEESKTKALSQDEDDRRTRFPILLAESVSFNLLGTKKERFTLQMTK